MIKRDVNDLFYVEFYKGGALPEALQGRWSSRPLAHNAVVAYLMAQDVLGFCKWPGKDS